MTANTLLQPISQPTAAASEIAGWTLATYMQKWEEDYARVVRALPLFNPTITKDWTIATRRQFVRLFYHIRGHFFKFLWELGNEAPSEAAKEKVLDNIREEFGGAGYSHEELYYIFAQALGVDDIKSEWLDEIHHLPHIKTYNKKHLTWLSTQPWEGKWAAFAAYEKLDNIDYVHLYDLAESFELERRELAFFKVHQQADHFDRLHHDLHSLWSQDCERVQQAFAFIGSHQSAMWTWLSGALCSEISH